MLSFGLNTLPTGSLPWSRWVQLACIGVIELGLWTAWESWIFFDIMRGLANWCGICHDPASDDIVTH